MTADAISIKVGKNIKKIRELRNLTQEYVADQLEMTTSGYSKIERGEVGLNLDKLQKIASLLDLEINDLLSFDESIVFNNFGNAEGQSFSNHVGLNISEIIASYNDQISFLKTEIEFLRSIIEKYQ